MTESKNKQTKPTEFLPNEKDKSICISQKVISTLKKTQEGWAWWLTPIIPALGEAEAGGSRGQEIETILVNKAKPHLY